MTFQYYVTFGKSIEQRKIACCKFCNIKFYFYVNCICNWWQSC